jgi:hypothetical protein
MDAMKLVVRPRLLHVSLLVSAGCLLYWGGPSVRAQGGSPGPPLLDQGSARVVKGTLTTRPVPGQIASTQEVPPNSTRNQPKQF